MNVAIIPAAGRGTRLGASVAKQFIEIAGAPIILHTLRRFEECPEVTALAVAVPADELAAFEARARASGLRKPLRVVRGGAERSDSILQALEAIADWEPEIVAVHDAVRPFVTPEQIAAVIARARETGAAILAEPSTDTIKEVAGGFIQRTLDRRAIYRAQTPQAFRYELLRRANDAAREAHLPSSAWTDDALLVERLGISIAIVEGSSRNLKITTPEDLARAAEILSFGEGGSQTIARAGIGYDIHRLVEGRKLWLGGVEIEHERGLLGHSDGDSLTHAICDALLGAAALGDIGTHFSDRDPQYAGLSSLHFLRRIGELVRERGFAIANVDATILAERPRLAPHLPRMRERLAEVLGLAPERVNLKAKTNEGLDAVGRGEAIAAQSVVLLAAR
jgi:2-C-methyl-D-erythritol 4-phosphate cytidylyltransferase/2-C-methyl-D-erythritol 2,4-cyclodiphosphate synthase